MEKMVSFTQVEREIQPEFREHLNLAESIKDLERHFSHSMVTLLQRIVGDSLQLLDSDVVFAPEAVSNFRFHPRLLDHLQARGLLDHSDLPQVLQRFAASTNRRYQHLKKHPNRTRLKIRN